MHKIRIFYPSEIGDLGKRVNDFIKDKEVLSIIPASYSYETARMDPTKTGAMVFVIVVHYTEEG